ncbi:MAG: M23 family metallopeptidase [Elusimicrobiota bacterium]
MRTATKSYFIVVVCVAALAMFSTASIPAGGSLDYARFSVLTPSGPAEPPAEAFRRIPRLIHARHKVLKGEDIRTIAANYGTDVRSLQSTNNNEFIFLSKGGHIRVHNGRGYLHEVIVDGETLEGIARRFKPNETNLKDFKAAIVKDNQLSAMAMLAPYKFKKGDRLQLPAVYLNLDTYRMPLPYFSRVSSSFGMRYHPVLKRKVFHKGCDIPMPVGTPVFASRSGTIIFAGWKEGYGNIVEVRHKDGSLTRYGHLSKVSVGVGETVQKSKNMLGRVGATGMSTGPHLHFEIITPLGKSVNPLARIGKR